MNQYVKKPIPIQAEPYRPGMEDGWAVFAPAAGGGRLMIDIEPLKKYALNDNNSRAILSTLARSGIIARNPDKTVEPVLKTMEGWYSIRDDDYIVTGVQGERYPCAKDIFESTYSPVEALCPTASI